MIYCYKLLDIDFPDRGFLLFWQLPLNDKLKCFEINDDITHLRDIPDKKKRKEKLDEILKFLGGNPIEKRKLSPESCMKIDENLYNNSLSR